MGTSNESMCVKILQEVFEERKRQLAKWGDQTHPDGTGTARAVLERDRAILACDQAAKAGVLTWFHILNEEFWEAMAEKPGSKDLEVELIQTAAVAIAIVEDIRTRKKDNAKVKRKAGTRKARKV